MKKAKDQASHSQEPGQVREEENKSQLQMLRHSDTYSKSLGDSQVIMGTMKITVMPSLRTGAVVLGTVLHPH